MKRIDERDIIFSRMSYEKGSENYEDYYSRNPNKLDVDESLRELPGLGEKGTAFYNEIYSQIPNACFEFLGDIKGFSEGEPNRHKVNIEPELISETIKGIAKFYNAKLVGITEMQQYHYYSHRGRIEEHYGERIDKFHKYGIAFAVEMNKDMIFRAPQISESVAVTKGYVEAAVIGMILSYYIRSLGYDARNHMDGNYLLLAPLVARDAGLGEIGRSGILITRQYGPRVRLGVVTTDMPLICDEKEDFGITEFCRECEKCVKTCPGKAIPSGEMIDIDGIKRWKINSEECYRRWRSLGTDCGICMASCPFSDEIPEELLKDIRKSPEARQNIIKYHESKHGIRPFIKGNVPWIK